MGAETRIFFTFAFHGRQSGDDSRGSPLAQTWHPDLRKIMCLIRLSFCSRCARVEPWVLTLPSGADLGQKGLRQPPGRKEGSWGWLATAARATPGPGGGAGDETKKSKFAKRTWNVRRNQRDRKSMWGTRRAKGPRVGEYLHGAPVLPPSNGVLHGDRPRLPWCGRAVKDPPLRGWE